MQHMRNADYRPVLSTTAPQAALRNRPQREVIVWQCRQVLEAVATGFAAERAVLGMLGETVAELRDSELGAAIRKRAKTHKVCQRVLDLIEAA